MEIKSGDLKLRVKCSGSTKEQKFSKGMMVEVKSDEQGYHGWRWRSKVMNKDTMVLGTLQPLFAPLQMAGF